MSSKGSRWKRHLTDDQAENLEALLAGFGLGDAALEGPARADRVSITIHVSSDFRRYLEQLAFDYGLRGAGPLARLAVYGWAHTAEHPKRSRRTRAPKTMI